MQLPDTPEPTRIVCHDAGGGGGGGGDGGNSGSVHRVLGAKVIDQTLHCVCVFRNGRTALLPASTIEHEAAYQHWLLS